VHTISTKKMTAYKIKIAVFGIAYIMLGVIATGCSPLNRTQRGAAIGAGAGATVGAVIGKTAGNVALGAIIGGAVGGTAGAYIAHKMNQVGYLNKPIPGAEIIHRSDTTFIKFNDAIIFDQGSIDLKPNAQTDIKNLADALQANPQTTIAVIGHADSLETAGNDISMKRAQAVKSALVNLNIKEERITALGAGSADPVANNQTDEGRAKNRRVVIIITNSEMKERAAKNK
jgi:outer membrane protein OmpA-like peptidoglycan-associated protein